MKKLLFLLFATALTLTGNGASLDINGDFAKLDKKTKLPMFWRLSKIANSTGVVTMKTWLP